LSHALPASTGGPMRDLAIVVPSRGRPARIAALWEALNSTCTEDFQLVVGLDTDDPERLNYPQGPEYVVRSDLHYVVPWMNALAVPLTNRFRNIGMLGDDNLPRTTGWDARILEALEKTPFAFGNDLYPREQGAHPCHIFCHSSIIKALGYLGVPTLRHMFCDNAWMAWGKAVGITYLGDVIIEHLHFTVGKSPYDEVYQKSVALWDSDQAAFDIYVNDKLSGDITIIKAALENNERDL
jgi:hypothetical protein